MNHHPILFNISFLIVLASTNAVGQGCDLRLQSNPGHATKISPLAAQEIMSHLPYTLERSYCNEDHHQKYKEALWDLRTILRELKASNEDPFAYRYELLFIEEINWHIGPDMHQTSDHCVRKYHHQLFTEKPGAEYILEILDNEDIDDLDYGSSYFWFERKYMILQLCSEYIGNSSWGTHIVAYFRLN